MIARLRRRTGSALVAATFALGTLAGTPACNTGKTRSDEARPLPPGAVPVPTVASAAPSEAKPPEPAQATQVPLEQPTGFAPMAHAADPSVVTIMTIAERRPSRFAPPQRSEGLGTGFVVDKNGIILTNNHVVSGANDIRVQLSDDRVLPATVVGTDPRTDVAVVRIDAKDLRPLPLGDSNKIDVGDWVVAIGNPFGLSHTVSAGIISAKGRTAEDVKLEDNGFYDFLQTDASINPGNSGGPLLNLKGEVVGVNTAIRGDAQGIGFAIPINMVKQLLPMLLRDGHVTRSALGISIVDTRELTSEDRQFLKLGAGDHGAVISYVAPGGPADKAELAPGDVIVAFDAQPIERSTQLQWLASTAGVGRTVTLRVRRPSSTFDIKVTLGQLPDSPALGHPR